MPPETRRSAFQPVVAVVAIAAGVVLVIGVVHGLVVGDSSLWLLADAVILVASLTLLRALRRK
jgi:glucose dehydrogenase